MFELGKLPGSAGGPLHNTSQYFMVHSTWTEPFDPLFLDSPFCGALAKRG